MMVSIYIRTIFKRMNNVGEGGSSTNDKMSIWCELWNLFKLADAAKLLNDVKLVLLMS